jgi:hypothetical protein
VVCGKNVFSNKSWLMMIMGMSMIVILGVGSAHERKMNDELIRLNNVVSKFRNKKFSLREKMTLFR